MALTSGGVPPPRIAPAVADARMSAPVFLPCMRLSIERRRQPALWIRGDARKIDRLAADHPCCACRLGNQADHIELARQELPAGRPRFSSHQVESQRQQTVARENRLALARDD